MNRTAPGEAETKVTPRNQEDGEVALEDQRTVVHPSQSAPSFQREGREGTWPLGGGCPRASNPCPLQWKGRALKK